MAEAPSARHGVKGTAGSEHTRTVPHKPTTYLGSPGGGGPGRKKLPRKKKEIARERKSRESFDKKSNAGSPQIVPRRVQSGRRKEERLLPCDDLARGWARSMVSTWCARTYGLAQAHEKKTLVLFGATKKRPKSPGKPSLVRDTQRGFLAAGP